MRYPPGSPADLARQLAENRQLRDIVIAIERLREQLDSALEVSRKKVEESMSMNPNMPAGKAVITPQGPPGSGQISESEHDDWKRAVARYFASPHAYPPSQLKGLGYVRGRLLETATGEAGSAIPEIWGREVAKLSEYKAVLRKIVREDTTLKGGPGDRLNISTLGFFTATRFTEGTAPTAITPVVGGVAVTLVESGCYVTITKSLQEDAVPGLINGINDRMAEANERLIDSDILNCLQNTTDYGALAGTLTEAGKMAATIIAKACGSLRAGTYEPAYLIIHTTQEASLLQDSQFTSAANYGNREVIQSGRVYDYLGLQIVPTPLAPTSGGTYTAFLVCRDAAILGGKRGETVETDYNPVTRTTHIVNSMRYGTAIQHPKGIYTILTVNG